MRVVAIVLLVVGVSSCAEIKGPGGQPRPSCLEGARMDQTGGGICYCHHERHGVVWDCPQ